MLRADEQRVIDDIAEHGWHCVHVLEDEEGPGFAYSVGLGDTLNAPELIVFGLKREVMRNMIWEATRQLMAGLRIENECVISNLIADHPCVTRFAHATWLRDYFGYAIWYYRHRGKFDQLKAFQIFWPGKFDGLFPWQDGCAEIVIECQPLLYHAKVIRGHA